MFGAIHSKLVLPISWSFMFWLQTRNLCIFLTVKKRIKATYNTQLNMIIRYKSIYCILAVI